MNNDISNKPLVSVVIPTYKRPDTLGRAIESVLNQTYNNIEIVVVDDNIRDSEFHKKTLEVIRKYPSVIYLKTAGKTGGGAARNFACRQASGDYLTFLDDDDVYLPKKVDKQIIFMLNNDLDFSYEDCALYDVDDNLKDYRNLNYVESFTKQELLRQHILHSIGPSSVYMVKKDEFLKTEGFGEFISGQDWFLMLRCVEADMKMGYLPGSDVKQYLHDGERISLGTNKIKGENNLYEWRKKYFPLFNYRERQYIRFRHRAVLAFSCMRSGMYSRGIAYAVATLLTSPSYSIKEAISYCKKD